MNTEEMNISELIGNKPITVTLTGEQWRDILGLLMAAKEFHIPVNPDPLFPIFREVLRVLKEQSEWPEELEAICQECKCPLSDGHYDAEHDICSIAERAWSEMSGGREDYR